MTDKELQDLIGLKKYEQPNDGYFEDFLVEFQQRQRSEILQTSARGLFLERLKTWFSEFGVNNSVRWIMGGGLAYAAFTLFINLKSSDEIAENSTINVNSAIESKVEDFDDVTNQVVYTSIPVSMEFANPVDFSGPKPVFSTQETFF